MTRDELLTTRGLSELLEIPVRQLEHMRYRGLGPKFVKIGKHVRYRMSDVEAYLEAQTVQSTADLR